MVGKYGLQTALPPIPGWFSLVCSEIFICVELKRWWRVLPSVYSFIFFACLFFTVDIRCKIRALNIASGILLSPLTYTESPWK